VTAATSNGSITGAHPRFGWGPREGGNVQNSRVASEFEVRMEGGIPRRARRRGRIGAPATPSDDIQGSIRLLKL